MYGAANASSRYMTDAIHFRGWEAKWHLAQWYLPTLSSHHHTSRLL